MTTSLWSRRRLVELYALPPDRVHVAPPGVDSAPLADGSATGARLLCVAAVTPHKGHDVLVAALADRPVESGAASASARSTGIQASWTGSASTPGGIGSPIG